MLQSTAKGVAANKTEARPATEVFVTEPLNPHTIAVGDAAHKNARRVHDATLVGLAPPPPVHVSSANTQPLAMPTQPNPVVQVVVRRDERRLATILVVGTLIAMFSIAYSAIPEREPSAAAVQAQNAAQSPVVPKSKAEESKVPEPRAQLPAQRAPAQANLALAGDLRVPTTKAKAPVSARAPAVRVKASTKTDAKTSLRRRKPSAN